MLGKLVEMVKSRYHRAHPEKRRYPRVPLKCKVTSLQSGFFQYYISTNISVGGMFLVTREPKPEGSHVSLEFTLPPDEEKIAVTGTVVRVLMGSETPGRTQEFFSGMGIRFDTVSSSDMKKIEAYIDAQPEGR